MVLSSVFSVMFGSDRKAKEPARESPSASPAAKMARTHETGICRSESGCVSCVCCVCCVGSENLSSVERRIALLPGELQAAIFEWAGPLTLLLHGRLPRPLSRVVAALALAQCLARDHAGCRSLSHPSSCSPASARSSHLPSSTAAAAKLRVAWLPSLPSKSSQSTESLLPLQAGAHWLLAFVNPATCSAWLQQQVRQVFELSCQSSSLSSQSSMWIVPIELRSPLPRWLRRALCEAIDATLGSAISDLSNLPPQRRFWLACAAIAASHTAAFRRLFGWECSSEANSQLVSQSQLLSHHQSNFTRPSTSDSDQMLSLFDLSLRHNESAIAHQICDNASLDTMWMQVAMHHSNLAIAQHIHMLEPLLLFRSVHFDLASIFSSPNGSAFIAWLTTISGNAALDSIQDFAAAFNAKDVLDHAIKNNIGYPITPWAMHLAVLHNRLDSIRHLHETTSQGCTELAMDIASEHGHLDIVKYLHTHRPEGCTREAINRASANGHLAIVKFLAEHRSEGCSSSAFCKSAIHGHVEVFDYLCKAFPDVCDAWIRSFVGVDRVGNFWIHRRIVELKASCF